MRMPIQKPGRSKQDYESPADFMSAVEYRFGALDVDLAAREDNAKAPIFITPEEDSLSLAWGELVGLYGFDEMLAWLNPPFGHIAPWARKCLAETSKNYGLRILLLTPASVGSNWFADSAHEQALVLFLNGRLQFVGTDAPYPKDCILTCYGFDQTGYELWRWRDDVQPTYDFVFPE
jgi:phage N-6-adenine-methyltransferase